MSSSEVIGSAFIELRIRSTNLSSDANKALNGAMKTAVTTASATLQEGLSSAGKKAGAAAAKGIADANVGQAITKNLDTASRNLVVGATDAGKKAGKALGDGIKEGTDKSTAAVTAVDRVTQQYGRTTDVVTSAQGRLNTAQAAAKTTLEKFGAQSVQARTATLGVRDAQLQLDSAIKSSVLHAQGQPGVFQKTGKASGALFAALSSNSNGALGPISELYDKVQGLGQLFNEGGKTWGSRITAIGAAATGAGAVLGFINSREVGAQNQLKASITATGHNWDDYKEQIDKAVKSGEGFGHQAPDTLQALNRLTIYTKDPAQSFKLLQVTMDASAARHIPLVNAANLIGRAYNGQSKALQQFGLNVSAGTKLTNAAATADKAHLSAVADLAKAQQALSDKLTVLNSGKKGGSVSSLTLAKANLTVENAQRAYNKALDEYGPGSDKAKAAGERLGIAQQSLTAKMGSGGKAQVLTAASAIALRKAHDAVAAAQLKVAQTAEAQKKAHDATKGAITNNKQALEQLAKTVHGQAAAQTDNFTGKLRVLQAQVEDQVSSIGGHLFPVLIKLGPAMLGIGTVMESGVIGKFAKGTKNLITFSSESKIVGATTKIWEGLSNGVGKVTGLMGKLRNATILQTAATKIQTAAQAALDFVLDANPVFLIVAAIVALVAIMVVLYFKVKPVRDIINDLGNMLKGAFIAAVHAVIDAFTSMGKWISKVAADIWSELKTWGPTALLVIAPFIGIPLFIFQHWNQIVAYLAKAWDLVWPYLKTWGPVALAVLVPFIGIPLLIWQHFGAIKGYLSNAFSAALNAVTGFVGNIIGSVASIPGRLLGLVGTFAASGSQLIGSIFSGITDGIKNAGGFIANFAKDMGNAVINAINDALSLPFKVPEIGLGFGISIGGETLIPRIPNFADGGIVPATPGGKIIRVAEAGQAEAIVPVPQLRAMLASATSSNAQDSSSLGGLPAGILSTATIETAISAAQASNLQALTKALATANSTVSKDTAASIAAAANLKSITNSYNAKIKGQQSPIDADNRAIAARNQAIASLNREKNSLTGPTYLRKANAAAIDKQIAALNAENKANAANAKAHATTETAIKKTASAAEGAAKKVADSAAASMKAAVTAAATAKAALTAAATQGVTDLVNNFQSAASNGAGVSDLFSYQAGVGPLSVASVEAQLQQKISQTKAFGALLVQLGKKGLSQDLLNQLVQVGPTGGIPIAQELLGDPSAILSINGLESQLAALGTSGGGAIAGTAAGVGATAAQLGSLGLDRNGNPAGGGPGAQQSGALLHVSGDLVVQDATDIAKVGQLLYAAQNNIARAAG